MSRMISVDRNVYKYNVADGRTPVGQPCGLLQAGGSEPALFCGEAGDDVDAIAARGRGRYREVVTEDVDGGRAKAA
jgi:hypothetical protein